MLNIGDKVRFKNIFSPNAKYCVFNPIYNLNKETILTVIELRQIEQDAKYNVLCSWEGYYDYVWFSYEDFELVEEKKTIMSKVINYVKNLALSADEKILRKHGLKDENGAFTAEAYDVVKAKLVADNEAYLIEVAKGLEAEEKNNK